MGYIIFKYLGLSVRVNQRMEGNWEPLVMLVVKKVGLLDIYVY